MKVPGLAASACCLTLSVAPALGAAATYQRYKARRTFAPDKGVGNSFGKSDVLAVDFLTTGFARPDGSDIRVFAGKSGRPVDFKVLMMGPGDRARIAVRMRRGADAYHVCYGGPRNPRPSKWAPAVGLTLETRKFNGGNVRTWGQMQKLVQASGPRYGTWLVPHIFHGFNPFGPSDSYVSIYRGWLHVPKAGTYRFATTSDDASYFLLDGKVVSRKPRWGRGPPNARFRGQPVTVAAGAHRLEYYHVEGRDSQFCVGAWQPPGGRFGLIPPSAFPGVFTAKQTGLLIAGSRVPIDLRYRADGEVLYETHHLYKVRFRDATPDGQSRQWSPKWFFGDGTSSEERHPEHVYFLPGEYTVSFVLIRGATAAKVRQTIVVGQDWEHQGQRRRDTSARYYQRVKDYGFPSMRSPDLVAAFEFFVTLGKDTEIMKTAAALLARDDKLARRHLYRCSRMLGERLRDLKNLPDKALVVFRSALAKETDNVRRARLVRRVGDTLLYALGKPDEALREYAKILDQYGKLEDNIVRLAQIRVGDAYRAKRDYGAAVAAYRKAETMPRQKPTYAVDHVRRGAFAQSIEDYVKRREFTQAQTLLDIWGWEHPSDRIAGHWSLTAAKLALAKGDKLSAVREAVECADANPGGRHADELLLFAGRVHLAEGRAAEAIAVARRVLRDHPETAFARDAALLECEGLYRGKQYHEAAKRAAEAYEVHTPKTDELAGQLTESGREALATFLMVRANAALASRDRTGGVRALRRIVKDHPRTRVAQYAEAKLKALGIQLP